jgi:hypothetical protein
MVATNNFPVAKPKVQEVQSSGREGGNQQETKQTWLQSDESEGNLI